MNQYKSDAAKIVTTLTSTIEKCKYEQHSYDCFTNTIHDYKADLYITFNKISTTIMNCKSDYNTIKSIQHTINNYRSDADSIILDLKQTIQACQSEHTYFENISQNVNDCNNNVYTKLRDIQTTMNDTKAAYVVVGTYYNKVVNFKTEVDIITVILNMAISNSTTERIHIDGTKYTIDKYKVESETIVNNLKIAIKNCTAEQIYILNQTLNDDSIQTTIDKFKLESNDIITNLSNAVSNCKSSSSRDNEIQKQLTLLKHDRNLVRDKYLEMQKERMTQTVEHNHLMATLKADQLELRDIFAKIQVQHAKPSTIPSDTEASSTPLHNKHNHEFVPLSSGTNVIYKTHLFENTGIIHKYDSGTKIYSMHTKDGTLLQHLTHDNFTPKDNAYSPNTSLIPIRRRIDRTILWRLR